MYKIVIDVSTAKDGQLTLETESKMRAKSACQILKDSKVKYEVERLSKPVKVEF